mgnify:CR=1 FL=1
MRRALVAGLALSLVAPPLGVFLTLRGMSLVGDAMAHAVLPGVAVGFLLAGFSLPAMSFGGLLAGLPDLVEHEKVVSPALIVIGEVTARDDVALAVAAQEAAR